MTNTTTASHEKPLNNVDIEELLLQPEMQESLAAFIHELPRLATTLTMFGKLCDVAKETITDPDLMAGLEQAVREKAGGTLGGMWSAVQEAKQRAEENCNQHIGIFGLMRWLKEPAVQNNLRFVQALLNVLSERADKQGKVCH